jgi:hypothetical protein
MLVDANEDRFDRQIGLSCTRVAHFVLRYGGPLVGTDIKAIVGTAPARRLDALPIVEVIDELAHQVLESMRIEVLKVQRPECPRNAHVRLLQAVKIILDS